METALRIGLTNIVVAALIALLAAGASLIRSRPALAHALWLLVLLKLLTPPLWGVKIDRVWVGAVEPTAGISPPTAVETAATPGEPITEWAAQIERMDPTVAEAEPVFVNPRAGTVLPLTTAAPPVSHRSTKLTFFV